MMQALAGHDPRDPASAQVDIPDYRAMLGGDLKGKRIGIIRHFYEEDVPANDEMRTALEAAYDVLRGLGAVLEDVQIRPMRDYMDVKVTIAESELYSVHEGDLRTRPGDFGSDFLGRCTPACLISGADYVQAQRERRVMLAEMDQVWDRYDLLVTAGTYGPAPRFDSHRTVSFWEKPAITTPFNVMGGPALAVNIGFSESGLPLSMQIAGRPFADAATLQAGNAYENATTWRQRRPVLDPRCQYFAASVTGAGRTVRRDRGNARACRPCCRGGGTTAERGADGSDPGGSTVCCRHGGTYQSQAVLYRRTVKYLQFQKLRARGVRLFAFENDIIPVIQPRRPARPDHDGGVVFLDDNRSGLCRGAQSGPGQYRRVVPARLGPEIGVATRGFGGLFHCPPRPFRHAGAMDPGPVRPPSGIRSAASRYRSDIRTYDRAPAQIFRKIRSSADGSSVLQSNGTVNEEFCPTYFTSADRVILV